MFTNLMVEKNNGVATIWLNRPEIRNAFNEELIAELTEALFEVDAARDVRVVVIAGKGAVFCAGADINWMKKAANYTKEENQQDAMRLARLLNKLSTLSKPTVARVHGAAFGGAVGLVAACDIVIAQVDTIFCLSEVRLGLIPATISPYVLNSLGMRSCRRYMLTAEKISAEKAQQLGLVHEICEADGFDQIIDPIIKALKLGGPKALETTKILLDEINGRCIDDNLFKTTAEFLANSRVSREGKEGVSAFLGKRIPSWIKS